MYLRSTLSGEGMSYATLEPPFGPGFTEDQVKQADKMEVWCSGFKDPGPDFTRFKLLKGDETVASQEVGGY